MPTGLVFSLYEYVESVILSWLMSLEKEDYLKGSVIFTVKNEKLKRKITIKYSLSIAKEMRKRIREDKRIATGIIKISISRRYSVFKRKKKVEGGKKDIGQVEIILRRSVEEKPTKSINEEALLIDILISEAPRGSVPIYLLAVAYKKIKNMLNNIKNDIDWLEKEVLNEYTIQKVEIKVSSRRTTTSPLDILKIFLQQIFAQAMNEDEIESVLLEFKRVYGFEESKLGGHFKKLYESAFKVALRAFTVYYNLIFNTYSKQEVSKKVREVITRAGKFEIYADRLDALAKKMPKKYYNVLKRMINYTMKRKALGKKKEKKTSRSEDILQILLKSWKKKGVNALEDIASCQQCLEKLSNIKSFEAFLEDLFWTSDKKLTTSEKISLGALMIFFTFGSDKDALKNLLTKLESLSFESRSLPYRILNLYLESIGNPDLSTMGAIDLIHKLLIYPINIADEFQTKQYLKAVLILSFGAKLLTASKLGLIARDRVKSIKDTYLEILEEFGIKKEIADKILTGMINVS